MIRLNALTNALVALAATLTLAACGGTVDFSIDKSLDVDTTVNSGKAIQSFDLAASAGSAWKQRKHISSVHVTQAEATVTAELTGNTSTASMSGEVWLLPEGATDKTAVGAVKVGDWTGQSPTIGTMIDLTLSPALDTFVRDRFNGNGKFSVYAEGDGGGARVHCTLRVVIGAKLKWKLP